MEPPMVWKAIRRDAIRWWLGLGFIGAGALGLLDHWGWGPKWSQTDNRWFWPCVIMAFGVAAMLHRGMSLALVTIALIGLALLVWQPWFWFTSLGLIGAFIALEPYLRDLFRKPEQQTPGKQSPQR